MRRGKLRSWCVSEGARRGGEGKAESIKIRGVGCYCLLSVVVLLCWAGCAHNRAHDASKTPVFHVDFRFDVDIEGRLVEPAGEINARGATLFVTLLRHAETGGSTASVVGDSEIGRDGFIDFRFPLAFAIDEDATPENGFPGMENGEALGAFVEEKLGEALSRITIRIEIVTGGETLFERETVVGTLPRSENGVMSFDLGEVKLGWSIRMPNAFSDKVTINGSPGTMKEQDR